MAATGESQKPAPLLSSSDGPPPLLVKKLSEKAKTPTRGSAFAAGYDLYAAKECVIPKRGKALVDTDLAIAVGVGCCMRFFLFLAFFPPPTHFPCPIRNVINRME